MIKPYDFINKYGRKFKNIPILDGKKFNKVGIKGISWIDKEVSIKKLTDNIILNGEETPVFSKDLEQNKDVPSYMHLCHLVVRVLAMAF